MLSFQRAKPSCVCKRYKRNSMILLMFVFCGAAAQRGPWPPHFWGFLITQNDASQSVGLLWTSDQLVAETSTWQHISHKWQTSVPPVGFEPTISASERPLTYALDRAATGTGDIVNVACQKNGQEAKIIIALENLEFIGKDAFCLVFFGRVNKIAKSDYQLRHICPSAWNNSAPAGQIFKTFKIWVFFENLSGKFKFH